MAVDGKAPNLSLVTRGDRDGQEEYLFTALACSWRYIPVGLLEDARQQAGLDPEHETNRLGFPDKGIELELVPPVPEPQAMQFAEVIAQGLGETVVDIVLANTDAERTLLLSVAVSRLQLTE